MEPEMRTKVEAIQNALPPWMQEADASTPTPQPSEKPVKKPKSNLSKLKDARKKVEELSAVVRDDAFEYWVRAYLSEAKLPTEFTQSRVLYENYLKRAKEYGANKADKALSRQELATETQWGKMMGSLFPHKVRRRTGWFYPVRLKQGA